MDILSKIVEVKKQEVAARKAFMPLENLEQSLTLEVPCRSLSHAVRTSGNGIIAEHKRRSPSKSVINETSLLKEVVSGYEIAGVAGISVLTDTPFFGGSLDDLALASSTVSIPILRKEFIIDPYQIVEARVFGADAILLIAAVLRDDELEQFIAIAKNLGLDVLLEVHDRNELDRAIVTEANMIGVNNRNLKNFEVSIETSKSLSEHIPDQFVRVSESGISSTKAIQELRAFGYQGFLIGETFMRTHHPAAAAREFIEEL